jgi:type IV secretory pathway VirB2 component (pilin)
MKINSKQLFKISLATASILALFPILSSNFGLISEALAQENVSDVSASVSSNSLTRVMCNALRIVTGSAGKTFATFAIIATGIGFFTGKVSWGLMIGVAAGIATMFGGPSIVAAISGQKTDMMCSLN